MKPFFVELLKLLKELDHGDFEKMQAAVRETSADIILQGFWLKEFKNALRQGMDHAEAASDCDKASYQIYRRFYIKHVEPPTWLARAKKAVLKEERDERDGGDNW